MSVMLLCGLGALASAQDPADAVWKGRIGISCLDCHGAESPKGGLDLESILDQDPLRHTAVWEKVVRKLSTRQMPPPGKTRPSETEYEVVLAALEGRLDAAAAAAPDPGRTDTIRRLTRLEYRHAVRDLLHLDLDVSGLLPVDESTHGFDSATAGTLSATLLERYLSAAERVSRLALGRPERSPGGETYRVPGDVTQEERVEGLPPGTRGGLRVRVNLPADGDYEVRIRLTRDRDELVEGLRGEHELIVLLDRRRVRQFTVKPPRGEAGHADVDAHLQARIRAPAGPHELGVTFLKKPSAVIETLRQPYDASFNAHRHPRQTPAIFEVSLVGPYDAAGPGDSPSRRRLLLASPDGPGGEEAALRAVLTPLIRRAFRRPATPDDLERLGRVFHAAREGADFETGLEAALAAVLVSHDFLFRIERDPAGLGPKTAYALGDLELATRLSFFLWSAPPDDELLELAERGALREPGVLAAQTRRLLKDSRARSLADSFAAQWLQIRNLEAIIPDRRLFPDFDDNLRQSMRRETEILFEELLDDDRSVLSLIRPDHAWLDERLARHYGIPHVYGTRFRRVELGPDAERGGLLRHGSVLTVTSYANRTSPVLRGKWILETLIGTPPPPPPPDVPALDDDPISESLPVRERLKLHRKSPTCASCHRVIDPVGFGLEQFDSVGRRRSAEAGVPVDPAGELPDGTAFQDVASLEQALLKRPEAFVAALAERLLVYALGRALEPGDGPAVRGIVRASKASGHRLSGLIAAVVDSVPFRMRRTP